MGVRLSKKKPDFKNEDFQTGVRYCIEKLHNLNNESRHTRIWNYSASTKFAPVELGDYLMLQVRKDIKRQENE